MPTHCMQTLANVSADSALVLMRTLHDCGALWNLTCGANRKPEPRLWTT